MALRVNVETSVWVMAIPGQNPALREPTLDFFDLCRRQIFHPYVSAVVADELKEAPEPANADSHKVLGDIKPLFLPMTQDAEDLAWKFIEQGIITERRLDDARHVGCAMDHKLDLLVSWNYRHIANVRRADAFNAVAVLAGYDGKLAIHTPLEVLEWN